MKVRCERDGTEFEALVRPYPSPKKKSKIFHRNGDQCIDCPTCGRRYFLRDEQHLDNESVVVTGPEPKAGDFVSDRVLTLL